MKLTDIKRLLSNAIESNDLLTQTNRIKLSLEDNLLPMLEKQKLVFERKLVSREAKQLVKSIEHFKRDIKEEKFFETMLRAGTVVHREAETLERMLDASNAEAIMREGMNIKDGHVIQFITLADYFVEAVRSMLVVINEFEVYHVRGLKPERSMLTYYENNFTERNLQSIAMLISFFASKEKEEVISKIYELPDIKIDENVINTIESTEGQRKIDPAGFNPLLILNPTFYAFTLQKIWSEIKFYRLDKAKEEMEYLELRLQELKLLREDRNNPDLERKIDKYQDRIQVLRVKIERITKRVG